MAASFHLQTPLLHKSHFLGQTSFPNSTPPFPKTPSRFTPSAKFNLFEILGGRGLLNGEEGIQQLLKENTVPKEPPPQEPTPPPPEAKAEPLEVPEDAFGKELLGLTGGFPGGEKGLQKFIEENPPPKKGENSAELGFDVKKAKAKAPELPLLLPGMIAIVKNPKQPYYMYCGIVQRITDGKAGVLFEGGNWDRLITFRLEELERREKGPPMVNPRSAILEETAEK